MKHDIERVDAAVREFYNVELGPDDDHQRDLDDFSLIRVKVSSDPPMSTMTLQITPMSDSSVLDVVGVASFTPIRRWLVESLHAFVGDKEMDPLPVFDLGFLRSADAARLVLPLPSSIVFSRSLPLIVTFAPLHLGCATPVDLVLVCDRYVVPPSSG